MRLEEEQRQLLSAWVDGEVGADDSRAAEALLESSADAREWVEQARGLAAVLASMPVPRPVPVRPWWSPVRVLGTVAASVAALLVGVTLFTSPVPVPVEVATATPEVVLADVANFDCYLSLSEESNYHVTLSGEEAQLVSLQFSDGNRSSKLSFQSGEF